MTTPKIRSLVAIAVVLGLFSFACWALLRSPCLGVADNLDYWRVMRPAGIEHVEPLQRPVDFVRCSFATSEAHLGSGLSSASLVAWSAKHVGWGLSAEAGRMDLRQVGFLYLLLTVCVFCAGIAARVPPLLLAAFVYVLVDPGYLLFFNSFYADSALFVGQLGTAVWFSRIESSGGLLRGGRARRVAAGLALVALALLGGGSKMQYMLLPAAVLVALGTVIRWRSQGIERAPSAVSVALAGALLLTAVALPAHFYLGPAPRFLQVNNFHVVYAGILQVSGEPDRVLSSLGIPDAYRNLPRKDVWSGRIPVDHPVHAHLEDLSRWRLLGLFLREPRAVKAAAIKIQRELAAPVSHTRGNFSRDAGRPRQARYAVPWQFSRLRGWLVGPWPPAVWLVPLLAAAWLLVSAWYRSWDGRRAAALFLLLFAASQFVVVVLGDGFVALRQHLLGARLALDLLLVLLLWEAITTGARWLRGRRTLRLASSPGTESEDPREAHGCP